MFATGRSPNVRNLGLESVGVQMDQNSAIKARMWLGQRGELAEGLASEPMR